MDFFNLIYFTTCDGWQKPDYHYVTKSHKIIAYIAHLASLGLYWDKIEVILITFCSYIAQYITVPYNNVYCIYGPMVCDFWLTL